MGATAVSNAHEAKRQKFKTEKIRTGVLFWLSSKPKYKYLFLFIFSNVYYAANDYFLHLRQSFFFLQENVFFL